MFLSRAEEELRAFAEKTGIPVITTMMGLSLLPTEHPLNMGMIGAHGNTTANKALVKSDMLIMIGTRAADRAIISPDEIQRRMAVIHIDVDPAEIGKNMQSTLPLVGSAKVILQKLMERGAKADCDPWREALQDLRRTNLSRGYPTKEGYVFPGRVLRLMGERLREDAAVCVDVGQNQIWACKHLRLRGGRFLTSGGLGTMGYAIPCAVGVKTAQRDRQVVAVCGDGSFQMSMNELAAVKAHGFDLKILLFRNGVLGLVNQIQGKEPYHGPFGVNLEGDPDFAAIAGAYGIPSLHLSDEAEVEAALDRFLAMDGPCLLIAEVSPEWKTTD